MDAAPSKKRPRDGSEDSPDDEKRVRTELLFDVFNDGECYGDRDTAAEDIASVIRGLEEEIGYSRVDPLPQNHLGFLLEASDDELGLPPSGSVTSSTGVSEEKPVILEWETEGQIWGIHDEITCSYGYGFDGLFDYYSDELFLPTAYYCDASWRQESLPFI